MKLITLLGQTSSGKSEMAVALAQFLGDCWIVNCDSRQIYRQLDIGTGKVSGEWKNSIYYYRDIPHFLLDYVEPTTSDYNLVTYVQDFNSLCRSNSQPRYIILTGGTGLYAKAITQKYDLGLIKPKFQAQFNELKTFLQNQNLSELQTLFSQKNQSSATANPLFQINNSDFHNPRRLISKLLQLESLLQNWKMEIVYPEFETIQEFAITVNQEELKQKIRQRLQQRMGQGLLAEVHALQYLGRQRLLDLGLEYRLSQLYLEGAITKEQWQTQMHTENQQYAKRQLTWLKKQTSLLWIKNVQEIQKTLQE